MDPLPRSGTATPARGPWNVSTFATIPLLLTLLLGLVVPASLHGQDAQEPEEPEPGSVGTLYLDPLVGPLGTSVQLDLHGLPPSTGFVIAFGGLRGGYQWVDEVVTDDEGQITEAVVVPEWAEEGQAQYFFVKLPGQAPVATRPFYVTDGDAELRVLGRIVEEDGVEAALQGPEGELYCLIGAESPVAPGDRVRVDGTAGSASDCPDGIPLNVRSLEPA